ncbi:NAD(P)H dehydrogenase (quinone) [Alphaproteobacteria bacterium SO-S41]|nr:NAD(P)H dehydrogenase (quinone) [Alphaproteobacteria bacterium SO-S41]
MAAEGAASPRLLIVFYSRGGSVETLATAIAEGAQGQGAEVRIRRARELVGPEIMDRVPGWRDTAARMNALYEAPTLADAEWADGLLIGAPTRFGTPSTELLAWLETLGPLWLSQKLLDKVGSVFTSTSSPHGGMEATLLGLYPTLAHLNLVIVPTGYGDPALFRAGTPYGAASASFGMERRPPSDDDLAVARYQGARVARVAQALRTPR